MTRQYADPTAVPEWISQVSDNGGTPRAATDNVFETMMDDIFIEGGVDPDVIWTTFGVQRNYAAQMKTQRRFDSQPVTLAGGFQAPSVSTPRGTIGFMVDRFCPEGTAFVMNSRQEIERAIAIATARFGDMMALRRLNAELRNRNEALQEALDKVKQLSGLLPICANCKKIRDDEGYWQDVAVYLREHSEAEFTHGLCPDCIKALYPEAKLGDET